MPKTTVLFACLMLLSTTAPLAASETPKETAEKTLSDATGAMVADESGQARLAAYGMAYEWGAPTTEGAKGAILAQMGVNHTFGWRLTIGDFREDLLAGFDSKANMRFAIMHGGIGDSCEGLAGKKFILKIASRAGTMSMEGGPPRSYDEGKTKGCFVQIVANSFKLRDLLNRSAGLSVSFTLNVDGTDRPIFYKGPGPTAAFRQTADVMIARQNLAIVNDK